MAITGKRFSFKFPYFTSRWSSQIGWSNAGRERLDILQKIDTIFTSPGVLEAIGVEIETHTHLLLIIYVYRHLTQYVPLLWENLFNSISSSSRILITGNFNAYHISRGCHNSNGIGKSLFPISQEFSLFSINDGSPTFIFLPSHAPSVIILPLPISLPFAPGIFLLTL